MDFADNFQIIKIFFLTVLSFVITIIWTPALTHFLYKYKLGKTIRDDVSAPVYSRLHQKKSGTPTMGGVLVWGTVLILALLFFYLGKLFNLEVLSDFNFLTRSETLLPLGALIATAIIGLLDDFMNIKGIGPYGGGLKIRYRLLIYTVIAAVGAYWFYSKLDWDVLHVPFLGNYEIGLWYIPIFIIVIVATSFSVNEIDGLDGLSGGTLLAAFGVYAAISFSQGRYDLATFCGVIVGALFAFLWFNIPPARFFMGDTGAMALGTTLGIVAMLTNTALVLPIIGLLFVIESLSVIIQLFSRRFFKKRVFLSAPIHHHLEASGWPETKIVMRFWIIAAVTSAMGLIIVLIDKS
ncbi:phospho-N-acetylmuramoyl-pentapeptide-transferase [Patescibacteria group bacterium]|nr:phospho-N-acetylmuramoyl-pentapeptide-transferase [Patescibacteria group bacterium]MBU1890099.1 phospho-N-acetylmuramoyl-pentapeptide-transferase [Patescibacteria group bacterium]